MKYKSDSASRTSADYWRTRCELEEVEVKLLAERAARLQYSLTMAENEIASLKEQLKS